MSTPGTPNFPTSLNDAVSLFETANRVRSKVSGVVTDSQTTLTILDASGWPTSGTLTFVDGGANDNKEICFYTGKTGNQLTGVLRGQDGSSAQTHLTLTSVELRHISRHHQVLSEAIRGVEAKLGIGSTTPDTIGYGLRVISPGETAWVPVSGSGTVTSVGLSLPSIFTVSGSPILTSGTLSGSLNTQAANRVFAGPSTGSDAVPTFRALVSADIPSLSYEPANSNIQSHISSTSNPHSTTKTQVGLGNVENTALGTWAGSTNLVTLGTIVTGSIPNTLITGLGTLSTQNGTFSDKLNASALSAFGLTLVDDADASTARTTLGLGSVENTALSIWPGSSNLTTGSGGTFGSNAFNSTAFQPLDSDLTVVALIGSALQLIRVNSAGTALEYFTQTFDGGSA